MKKDIIFHDKKNHEYDKYDNKERKKRKIYNNIKPLYFLKNFEFSFKFPIQKYYVNNKNTNNILLLNKLLKYIINIRNCMYNDPNYKNNNIYYNIKENLFLIKIINYKNII